MTDGGGVLSRTIDPYSLRLFVAAAREGSLGRAAEREHIAASALSRRIALLEHAIGTPLFQRSPRGIALTDAGRVVFDRGAKVEDAIRDLVRDVQVLTAQVWGTLRLFANPSAVVGFLPERLKEFVTAHPLVEIALQERNTDEIVAACLDDRADLGIGALSAESLPTVLDSWHFADDPLVVVMPLRHALTKRRTLSFADVLGHPLVGIRRGGSLDLLLQDQAAARSDTLKTSIFVGSTDAACRMVEAGFGVAVLPSSAASVYPGTRRIARRPLDEPWANRELRLLAPRHRTRLRATEAAIDALRR